MRKSGFSYGYFDPLAPPSPQLYKMQSRRKRTQSDPRTQRTIIITICVHVVKKITKKNVRMISLFQTKTETIISLQVKFLV